MKRKILSLAICLSMLVSTFAMMPLTVNAAETDATNESAEGVATAVNYTKVAPFLPAVVGKSTPVAKARLFSLFSANSASENTDDVQSVADQEDPNNGLEMSKTVSPLDDEGNGTITLEAYATGATTTTTTEEEIPTDIVLVLDQSGSMKDNITSYTDEYTQYTTNTNSNYYTNSNNIWYRDGDTYVKVKVSRNSGSKEDYEKPSSYKNYVLWYYADNQNLYINVDGVYKKVTVEYQNNTYTYSAEGVVSKTSNGYNTTVESNLLGYEFYVKSTSTVYTYTYTYTNTAGETVSITSDGGSTAPVVDPFYQRGTTTTSRLNALKSAVTNFTNSVTRKAKGADEVLGTEDDVNHRIAVVGFGSGDLSGSSNDDYENTELFIGASQYNYDVNASDQYANAFQNMNTLEGYNNVIASKKVLDASGGTYVDLGIEMANGIFEANRLTTGEKRNRVVIVFTDGAPGYNGDWKGNSYGNSGDAKAVANEAIGNAKKTKNDYGATVYTVGIFENANPEGTDNSNIFMNYVSSNYKNASSMDNPGEPTKPSDSSYYLSASDEEALNDIFQLISKQIESGGSSIELDRSAVIKDVMSDYFVIPEGTTTADINVKTAAVIGKNGDTYTFDTPADFTDAEVEINGNTVTVTNFNFKENYVGTDTTNGAQTHRGKKLIIEIPIKVRDGFWGGNQVPTNGTGSGIYENADKINANEPPVENFISPKADVPINVPDFDTNDTTIYYGNTISSETLYNAIKLTEGEEWKDDYVDLYYNTPQASDISNTACGEYNVSITLTPKYNDENGDKISASSDSKQAKVHILVPQITYNDSTIYLGETANYSDNQTENNVSWVDVERHSDISEATGIAPELTVSYNPAAGTFEETTPVNVQVKVGELDITDIVFFKNSNELHRGNENKPEFTVNVITCTLTIDKDVIGGIDADQTFIFTIIGDNANSLSQKVNLEVVVDGDGTATVTGLPVGTYTVTEQTDWSWRYTLKSKNPDSGQITLSKGNSQGTVTFTNERTESKWLDSNCSADNIFKHLTVTGN